MTIRITEGPRWWLLNDPNESNRINEVSNAAQFPVVGLVDEHAGGVVAYGHPENLQPIMEALNERTQASACS